MVIVAALRMAMTASRVNSRRPIRSVSSFSGIRPPGAMRARKVPAVGAIEIAGNDEFANDAPTALSPDESFYTMRKRRARPFRK
jgi:hypothetical protein